MPTHSPRRMPGPLVRLLMILLAVGGLLTAVSLGSVVFGGAAFQVGAEGHRLVNVGAEANIPTWWSSMLLAAGGVGYLVTALLGRRSARQASTLGAAPSRSRTFTLGCVGVGALLLAMSLDELASIHELLAHAVAALRPGTPGFRWLLLGIPIGLAALVFAVFVTRAMPPLTRRTFLAGLALFFVGALGLEAVGSVLAERDAYGTPLGTLVYHAEELAEMWGAALMAISPLPLAAPSREGAPTA